MDVSDNAVEIVMKKVLFATVLMILGASGAFASEATPSPAQMSPGPKNRAIGYVLNHYEWATYTAPDKSECPQGLNDGPRQQYEIQFPKDGTTRTVIETELAREAAIWFPSLEPEQFVFRDVASKIALGMNLDGKVGPNDFTSPEGETGIDNQFYRVVGCIDAFRPNGTQVQFNNHFMQYHSYTREVIELTDVDSLVDDDDVTVTTYRGLDPMLTDGTGNEYLPYGTQRIDMRWAKKFTQRAHGKIKNGVLISEPMDVYFPYNFAFEDFGAYLVRGAQAKLRITPEKATGLWGGYIDIVSWYRTLNRAFGTHTLAYGGESSASMYRALYRFADGYPDPKTGRNTAISSARQVYFSQVYVQHPDGKVATEDNKDKKTVVPLQKSAQNTLR